MIRYEVTPLAGYDDVIGRWLWALQEARTRALQLLQNAAPDQSGAGLGMAPTQ